MCGCNGDTMVEEIEKYAFRLDKPIRKVSLWVRTGDKEERPIYSNTRGSSGWYSSDVDEAVAGEIAPLSEGFIQHLHWYNLNNLNGNSKNEDIEKPGIVVSWYEAEVLNAIGTPKLSDEQLELIEWATKRSNWQPDTENVNE